MRGLISAPAPWVTLAEGNAEEFEQTIPPIDQLEPGTKLRLIIDTTLPIAPVVELWGMDWVIQQMLGSGVSITDVYATAWDQAVIEMKVAGSPVVAIIIGIIVVLSIAGIAYIVHHLKLMAEIAGPVGTNLLIFGGVCLLGYAVYKYKAKQRA